MKKLLLASLLTAAVVFAEATAGDTGSKAPTTTTKGKKHPGKKGGGKGDKGKKPSTATDPAPK
jgi:hypothetical protein